MSLVSGGGPLPCSVVLSRNQRDSETLSAVGRLSSSLAAACRSPAVAAGAGSSMPTGSNTRKGYCRSCCAWAGKATASSRQANRVPGFTACRMVSENDLSFVLLICQSAGVRCARTTGGSIAVVIPGLQIGDVAQFVTLHQRPESLHP